MMNNQSKNNNVSDELLYEFVMDEMGQESELIKGLWAKALAHSEGNDSKAKSLYMQYRVQAIKDQLSALEIGLGDLSKEELFESIKSGFTVIPEKIQIIKEEKAEAREKEKEKAIQVAIEEDLKKENKKYSKLGGWLIVLAIFLILGNLYGFLSVESCFENEFLNKLKYLDKNGMRNELFFLDTITYMNIYSYGLLLAFTISFFRKDVWTKSFAIIYFSFTILTFLIMVFSLKKIGLTSANYIQLVIGGVIQTLFALIWIGYFVVSKRVEKTFTKGNNEIFGRKSVLLIVLVATLAVAIFYNRIFFTDVFNHERYKKDCEAGYGPSCYNAGLYYDMGINDVLKDKEQAIKYYKKGCDLGDSSSCSSVQYFRY